MASIGLQQDRGVPLSRSWRPIRRHESSYTGGKSLLSSDGRFLACWNNDRIAFLDVRSGQIIKEIDADEDDAITTFAITPNHRVLFTAHSRTLTVQQWNIATGKF